jgi:Transposase, Mutator family
MLKVVRNEAEPNEASGSVLDEIVREAARQMLAVALQAEVPTYIDAHAEEVDENGHRLVVRNGHHNEREVITAAGPVPVRAPRVNDKRTDPATGERKRFASAILPAWARKSPRVAEVLPLLYLHGLSSSDSGPALTQFLGTSHGLSAATITRLTKDWQDEATTFNKRSLAGTDYVYCWVDGIHLKVRLEQDKVCLLVMIGVRSDGTRELIALDDGHRGSTGSSLDLLRGCKRRGMAAPVLAVGDGALGFWSAVREVFRVHVKGWAPSFQSLIHSRSAVVSSSSEQKTPRSRHRLCSSANHRSMFSQQQPVGVKCRTKRGWASSQRCTTGALWLDRLSQITWTVRPGAVCRSIWSGQSRKSIARCCADSLPDHRAGGDVQCREQVDSAVPHVVEAAPFGYPGDHRQHRGGPLQGLVIVG